MTPLLSFAALREATGARVIGRIPEGVAEFSSVCIDSRNAAPGALFIAMRGEKQDGHDYCGRAFAAGAVAAIVSEERLSADAELARIAEQAGALLFAVDKPMLALQQAAKAYLDRFPGLVRIGITGSSGKTTTKEIAGRILSVERKVVMNEGNLNSETGLPLSVFAVREEHEIGIFEMGMNRTGEIAELAAVLRPSIALITNVGTAHIGILGSREAIAEEKRRIFSRFTGTELALIGENEQFGEFLARGVNGRVVRFGPGSLAGFGGSHSLGLDGTEILWAGKAVRFALPGAHNLSNALAAVGIALAAGASDEAIRSGLASVTSLFGRGEVERGKIAVVRDCYNANPEAVEALLDFCDSVEWPGRKVYVIGSMRELGASCEAEHRRIGRRLAACDADRIFLFGEEAKYAGEELSQMDAYEASLCRWTDDMDALRTMLEAELREGDLVALKGSRGVALERLDDILNTKRRGA